MPIFTHNTFWSVITLANLNDDKYFDEDYVDLMRLTARMWACAVVLHESKRESAEKDELIRTMVENAPDG